MAEFIKREDAAIAITNYLGATSVRASIAANCILNPVQAADVRENVRGEWLLTLSDVYDFYKCSVCEHRIEAPGGVPHENFCPKCGADMRGDNDDT